MGAGHPGGVRKSLREQKRTVVVYVIAAPKSLSIQYETGISNICYTVGSQVDPPETAFMDMPRDGSRCPALRHPRRCNYTESFKDNEAFLLSEFRDKIRAASAIQKEAGDGAGES